MIQKRRESWRCRSLIVEMSDAEVFDAAIVVDAVDADAQLSTVVVGDVVILLDVAC